MSELLRWLSKLAERHQARPELFEALLTGHYRSYAYYRLRFMLPRIALRFLTQFFEVFVLASALPWEYFVPLLSYRASSSLLGGSYWGALEQLRSRVREDARQRHYESARLTIETWLGVSVLLALGCVAGIVLWTRYSENPLGEQGVSLFDAYALACFLRLAADLVARTYHAGIFALSRVYRPLATILLPDLMELGLIVLAWNQLGPWGIAVSILVSGATRSGWTYYYAHKGYTHSRIPLPRWSRIWRMRLSSGLRELSRSAVHALANASAQVDSMLILLLAHAASTTDPTRVPLAVVYYVMRPLISAAHGWTRAFYFDWKRLTVGVGVVFRPRMRAMLLRIGSTVALSVACLLGLAGYLLWREQGLRSVLLLLPLLMARTAFSIEQLEAFSLGQYARLARLASLVIVAVIVLAGLTIGEGELVVGSAAVLLLSVMWSRRARQGKELSLSSARGLSAWLVRLNETGQPVRVFALCANRQTASADRIVRASARCLAREEIARAGRSHVLGFALLARAPHRAELVAELGGAVSELVSLDAESGKEAALKLVSSGWFQRTLSIDLSVRASTREELIREFRAMTPEGHVLELDHARGSVSSERLSWAARRMVLREIASGASVQHPRLARGALFRVAVLAPRALATVVFVAPRNTQGFANFMRRVEHANLSSALS